LSIFCPRGTLLENPLSQPILSLSIDAASSGTAHSERVLHLVVTEMRKTENAETSTSLQLPTLITL
jgi:hypothetical protein